MTTADNARKESAFLYYDVPKKDQPVFDDEMKKHCGRMSADHISITMIGSAANDLFYNERDGTYELYDDSGELRSKEHKHIPPGDSEQSGDPEIDTYEAPGAHNDRLGTTESERRLSYLRDR